MVTAGGGGGGPSTEAAACVAAPATGRGGEYDVFMPGLSSREPGAVHEPTGWPKAWVDGPIEGSTRSHEVPITVRRG